MMHVLGQMPTKRGAYFVTHFLLLSLISVVPIGGYTVHTFVLGLIGDGIKGRDEQGYYDWVRVGGTVSYSTYNPFFLSRKENKNRKNGKETKANKAIVSFHCTLFQTSILMNPFWISL